ncbi:sugar ABC transporter substrate-binding protein [Solicola gregarius]|uniref:Sugar ABC transporter substrate-binding protein n=1 Tax=Solicola gregarius TaxID=2908642 RepID=A0AA46THE1_9ACTN|nr:sugar ABC transporter substrate-binding protein [Solicola gregarius]UYM05394.1 sugar ABC transporter substrate-binding protein [Solicola gregarius]
MKTLRIAAVAAAAALTLTACSGTGQDDDGAEDASDLDLTYAVVTHGAPDDAFWSVVKAGSDRAGEDLGVDVEYNSDPDVTKQAELIDAAVADDVDGIVVSMADPDGLEKSVKAAVEAGVPVITINSGIDESAEFGAITHVGQSETIAGEAAGEKFSELGAKKVICVIHEAGNTGLEQRCAGAKSKFGGSMENLQVDGADTTEAKNTIQSALQADGSIDGVLALNAQVALGAQQAVEESGAEVQIGTFDLSEDLIGQIQDGNVAFAVDQQPYTQGYLGVQFLYLNSINGNQVGGGKPVYSGPAFVTKENADEVLEVRQERHPLTR